MAMTTPHCRRLLVLTALLGLMLVACSGTGTEVEVPRTLIVHPETASASAGGTMLGATGGEIKQGMAAITEGMDTLVLGDILTFGEEAARLATTSAGKTRASCGRASRTRPGSWTGRACCRPRTSPSRARGSRR